MLSLAMFAALSPSSAADPTPRIFGGDEVVDDFDEAATVAVRSGAVLCTGTVVHPRLVITAAHCIVNAPDPDDPSRFFVVFGKDAIDQPSAVTPAVQVGVHPDYGGTDCIKDCYDLAYLVPEAEVNLAEGFPSLVTDQAEYDEFATRGGEVLLVGYGRDEANNVGIKRSVVSEIGSFLASGKEFWAGGDGRDTCLGDSGGPALLELPDGERRLLGVVSRGEDCGEGGVYGNPYAAACWIREETGVDLADGCEACDCVKLRKGDGDDGGCSVVTRRSPPPAWAFAWLAVWGLRRRRDRTARAC